MAKLRPMSFPLFARVFKKKFTITGVNLFLVIEVLVVNRGVKMLEGCLTLSRNDGSRRT